MPCCVELRGYGMPHYIAHGYPHKFAWPKILDRETGRPDYNPVLSYRRRFTVPAEWRGRETILRFEGVSSAFYVWINGREAGYAEDSKLPSEFNVTEFLKDGENDISVQVFRWCDGSYVEDQDMLRFSGIIRDVSLWSRPKAGIADFAATQTFGADYENARLDVSVSTYGGPGRLKARLYDAERRLAGEAEGGAEGALSIDVPHVRLWSAEKPYLYTLVLTAGEDVRAKRIGFKEQKISNGVFLVNGRPVKFKGVNRHETSPDAGRSVTLDDMVRDITLMKRYNIDTVRTSHYPDHRLWYDLCDRYGVYVVAEANVEAHGAGYGKNGFGPVKAWEHTIVERNERQVLFYRNNPSVTMWSAGNETKHGQCFVKAIEAVRRIDPSRPVHWERGSAAADVDAAMYRSVTHIEKIGAAHDAAKNKPFFHTEYAHAMGNAIGNFQEYWDAYYAHPSLAGGCVWDWRDQGVWAGTGRIDPATGREGRYIAYGGDFYDNPHYGPVCQNGIVGPTAEVTPKLVEVGHVHRNLVVARRPDGAFTLWNRHLFTRADEFDGSWRLLEDGVETASGRIAVPRIEPLSRGVVKLEGLDEALAKSSKGGERFVDVSFSTKTDAPWAKAGWVVARDQIALGGTPGGAAALPPESANATLDRKEDGESVTVSRGGTVAVFSRKSGLLTRLSVKGAAVLEEASPGVPAGPHLTCVRAFTDNDKWFKDAFLASGLARLGYHSQGMAIEGDTVKTVIDATGTKGCGFRHECEYRFGADGAVSVFNKATPYGTMPKALPRLGLSMRLVPALENVRYYGRGPMENYIDRCTGSFFGIYESTVSEQYVDYVKPQDNGGKSGVRWAEFTDGSGRGVRFSASVPMFMQALHYGWEDLFLARHEGWKSELRRYAPPVAQRDAILNLDVRQTGLGGASVGPGPLEKYRFDPNEPVEWRLDISPVPRPAPAVKPAIPPMLVPVGDVRVGFSIGDVASGQMKSLSVTTNGNVVTAVWKGHPSCGDGFTVTADLALLPGGGFEYASFRYAGKDDGQPVSRISFPEITVPRTGRTAIFRPNTVGEVYRPDWKKFSPGKDVSVSGANWLAFGCVAALNDGGTSHFLDHRGEARLHTVSFAVVQGAEPDTLVLCNRYAPPITDERKSSGSLPYTGVYAPYSGGWYEAAKMHRAWLETTPWFKNAAARDFSKLREIALWMWSRGNIAVSEPPVHWFMKETGLKVALDWYWWHGVPYDTGFPYFWPPRDGEEAFRAAVKRMKDRGAFVQVYTNGASWDCDDPRWDEDGGPESAIVLPNGRPFAKMYNVFTRHRLVRICGEAPKFQNIIRGLERNLRDSGLDGVYMDQIACGAHGPCHNPRHKHAPGGDALVDGYRSYVQAVRDDNPGFILSSETASETYFDLFEAAILLYSSWERCGKGSLPAHEPVPAVSVIYRGAEVIFGSFATPGGAPAWDPMWGEKPDGDEVEAVVAKYPDQFAVEFARGVVWGIQPMVHNFTMEDVANPRLAKDLQFMKDTARFYHDHRDFLFDGEMLKPVALKCATQRVEFLSASCYKRVKDSSTFVQEALPCVFHSEWRAKDGRAAAILVNWTMREQPYSFVFEGRRYEGRLPARAWRIVVK